MPRFAADITPEDLWKMLDQQVREKNPDEYDPEDDADPAYASYLCVHGMLYVGKIEADLKKVNFDLENAYFEANEEEDINKGLLGPRRHGNLSYIGFWAGGDWEQPLFFLIYLDKDGKTLRAYVPKDGNTWNYSAKSAFGNDEDADIRFLEKWHKQNGLEFCSEDYSVEDTERLFDRDKLLADIAGRIQVK